MSYELIVTIKAIDDRIIPRWIEQLAAMNTFIELHPNFTFENHAGFVPMKAVVHDCANSSLNNRGFMSGFELSVKPVDAKEPFWRKLFKKNEEKARPLELVFRFGSQDSFEFRLVMYSAVVLSELCDGTLFDPQEGEYCDKDAAKKSVKEYEASLGSEGWKYHEFQQWI